MSEKRTDKKLSPQEIELLAKVYDLPVPGFFLAQSPEDASEKALQCGFPLVMKIVSPDIYHKTDVGGICLNIKTPEEAAKAYKTICQNVQQKVPHACITGVSLEPMVPSGKEILMGVKKDPLGHLIVFGLGGIYVELLKDIVFSLAPITREEAHTMIHKIKTSPLLTGTRGEKGVPIDRIAEILVTVGRIVTDYPQIQELEINPLIATQTDLFAVDTNCILS